MERPAGEKEMRVEKARSGRSTCKLCHGLIDKGEDRVSEHGTSYFDTWYHVKYYVKRYHKALEALLCTFTDEELKLCGIYVHDADPEDAVVEPGHWESFNLGYWRTRMQSGDRVKYRGPMGEYHSEYTLARSFEGSSTTWWFVNEDDGFTPLSENLYPVDYPEDIIQ